MRCHNADHLQSERVATHTVNRNAGCNLAVTIMKYNLARVDALYHRANMIGGEGRFYGWITHAPARRKCHFSFLNMKTSVFKRPETACMVIVQMGDNTV